MSEQSTPVSMPARFKTGRVFLILGGLGVLAGALFYGVYLLGIEQRLPALKVDELFLPKDLQFEDRNPVESLELNPIVQNRKDSNYSTSKGDDSVIPEPVAQLPTLNPRDDSVRELLAGLSGHREYVRWIRLDHLIQKIALVVENISRGTIPIRHFKFLIPKEKFIVAEISPEIYRIQPEGYHRYNLYADTLASLDLAAGYRVYLSLRPLLNVAYQELGYPDGDFDSVLRLAIKHLLSTPVLSGEVFLIRPSVMYRFADPQIEALSPAQKQLIRMGPRNTRLIHSVLRDFLDLLGPTTTKSE